MSILAKRKNMDMINGPLLGKIIAFSVPIILTNLLQVLYNAADMMVVSLSSEPDAVGAIGTTTALTNLIVNIFVGFSTGANVVVARHIGAKEREGASRAVHTAIAMSLIFGLASALIGILLSRPILALMGVSGKLLTLATLYTRIYFLGVPFVALTNYTASILRAKGDAQTPLVVLALAGLLNVFSNLLFVLGFGMSVEGVALATALSNVISAALLLWRLHRDPGECHFSPRLLGIDKKSFLSILHVGLPTGIQSSLFSVSNILIQSSVLRLNDIMCPGVTDFAPVVKGNATSQNLGTFVSTANNAFVQAAITFTSQNVGAKKPRRVMRVLLLCNGLSLIFSTLFPLTIFLLRDPLFALYGVQKGAEGSLDRIAYEIAQLRTALVALPFATAGFMEICSGVAKGLGKAVSSTVITLIGTCALRVAWIYTVFRAFETPLSLYICYPVTWLLTGTVQCILVLLTIRHAVRQSERVTV